MALSDAEEARVEGVYWFDDGAIAFLIGRHENSLHLGIGSQRFAMTHTGDGVFRVPDIGRTVRFEPTAGVVERMLLIGIEDEESIESAAKLGAFDVEGANPAQYVADYRSPELPVLYHLELDEGQLRLHWLKGVPDDLMLVAEDLLIGEAAGSLRFQRDSSDEITGLVLNSGRVRNFRFERIR